MSDLSTAIIKTVAFFDIFNYPLTAEEIYRFLPIKTDLESVLNELQHLPQALATDQGFYFLANRQNLINTRRQTETLAQAKHQLALKTVKKLAICPGLKMVAVCNNFYYRPESDIDLFIITEAKRLWLSRLFITVLVQLLGRRRHGRKIADRLCLSFYISEDYGSLENLTLTNDLYFYYWLALLSPLYGLDTYRQFIQTNSWIHTKLPNLKLNDQTLNYCLPDTRLSLFFKKFNRFWFNSRLGSSLNNYAKKIQTAKMNLNTASLAKEPDTRVVIGDTILKFHENDRRAYFLEQYKSKIAELKL